MRFDKAQSLNEIDREIERLLEIKMRIQQKVRDVVDRPRVVYQGEACYRAELGVYVLCRTYGKSYRPGYGRNYAGGEECHKELKDIWKLCE